MRRRKLDLSGYDDDAMVAVPVQVRAWLLKRVNRECVRCKIARRRWLERAILHELAREDEGD